MSVISNMYFFYINKHDHHSDCLEEDSANCIANTPKLQQSDAKPSF